MKAEDFKEAVKSRSAAADLARWERKALAAFYGGDDLAPYILEHSRKEDPEKLDWRRARTISHYEPYPYEIASTYVEGVFRTKEVKRECGDEDLNEYFGREYDMWFQNDFAPLALNLPEPWIFFRMPDADYRPLSQRDVKDQKLWPRPHIELSSIVLNFKMGLDGCLKWVSRKRRTRTGDEFIEIYDDVYCYHVDGEGDIIRQAGPDNQPVDMLPHGFFGVPAIYAPWRRNYAKDGAGFAFLSPVIDQSIGCLQVLAMLVEAGYFHLHPQLVMTTEAAEKAIQSGMGAGQPIIADQPPGVSQEPVKYLQKPTTDFDILIRWASEWCPKKIYRLARLRDRSSDKAISGISKLMDAVPELAALSAVANYFQAIDQRVCELITGAVLQRGDATVQAKYPVSFDLKTPAERLTEIGTIASAMKDAALDMPPRGIAELLKQAFHALLPDADPETLKAIDTQIDEMATEEEGEEETASKEGSSAEPMPEHPIMNGVAVEEAEAA